MSLIKLFITRIFNPVHPHKSTCNLTALSALLITQTTERYHMPKRSRGKLFLSFEVQSLHTNCCIVDVASAVSVGCVARQVQVGPRLDSSAFPKALLHDHQILATRLDLSWE